MTTTTSPRLFLVSVYDGRTCLGFILTRANGFRRRAGARHLPHHQGGGRRHQHTQRKMIMDCTDRVIDLVREQLRRMPAFAGVTRDTFDNHILADLERDIRGVLERWADGIERVAYEDGRADVLSEIEMESAKAALEVAQAAKKNKKGAAA
jgi:hypothetical protein